MFLFDHTGNPPQILKNPHNITIVINGTNVGEISFDCITTISNHNWLVIVPNNNTALYYERPGLITTSSQSFNVTLTLNSTTVFCKATNASGSVMSTAGILTILGMYTQTFNA